MPEKKTKSGREILGYVIRSGKIPGQGRYLSIDGKWDSNPRRAYRYDVNDVNRNPKQGAAAWDARVVTIVPKVPTPVVVDSPCSHRDTGVTCAKVRIDDLRTYVADIARVEKERDAALKAALEAQFKADKILSSLQRIAGLINDAIDTFRTHQ